MLSSIWSIINLQNNKKSANSIFGANEKEKKKECFFFLIKKIFGKTIIRFKKMLKISKKKEKKKKQECSFSFFFSYYLHSLCRLNKNTVVRNAHVRTQYTTIFFHVDPTNTSSFEIYRRKRLLFS